MDGLSKIIKEELLKKGASIVGFADLSDLSAKKTEGFRYGISIAVALNPTIISGIENGPTKEYYSEYVRLNKLLDELDEYAAELLKSHGYKAFARTTKVVKQDEDTLSTILPHKTVATRAGLGWIGKCALLVTKEFGSAVRLSTILTDAELEVGTPINESSCGDCKECKNHCPGGAVEGLNWNEKLNREDYYNVSKCSDMARKLSGKIGLKERICGRCIIACPWTKKYLNLRKD